MTHENKKLKTISLYCSKLFGYIVFYNMIHLKWLSLGTTFGGNRGWLQKLRSFRKKCPIERFPRIKYRKKEYWLVKSSYRSVAYFPYVWFILQKTQKRTTNATMITFFCRIDIRFPGTKLLDTIDKYSLKNPCFQEFCFMELYFILLGITKTRLSRKIQLNFIYCENIIERHKHI